MNEREIAQLQRERDQAVARLRVANGHTEDAFKKLQTALREIDILRSNLSKTHDKMEQMQRDWLAERAASRAEIDEARFWAKKFKKAFLGLMNEPDSKQENKHGLHTATSTEGKHE